MCFISYHKSISYLLLHFSVLGCHLGFKETKEVINSTKETRDCSYLIEVPRGYRINITFNMLALKYTPNCSRNSLKIYDGGKESYPMLGKKTGYCGSTLPKPIISSGNSVLIISKSSNKTTSPGFILTYVRSKSTDFAKLTLTLLPTTFLKASILQGDGAVLFKTNYLIFS